MMGDPDVKVRTLAVEHGVGNAATFFADHAKAARLFAMAQNEKSTSVARSLVGLVTRLDADKLGLGGELVALAKSPNAAVRKALTSAIAHAQGPSTLAVITTLLNDPDREVKRSAISALSTGGITPAVDPVCKLLSEQIARTDNSAGDALWSGSSSKCEGMDKAVLEELGKRVADLSRVTNAVGIGYELAATGVCSRTKSPELKKTGFQILKKLTTSAVKDPNTRSAAVGGLSDCDPSPPWPSRGHSRTTKTSSSPSEPRRSRPRATAVGSRDERIDRGFLTACARWFTLRRSHRALRHRAVRPRHGGVAREGRGSGQERWDGRIRGLRSAAWQRL